MTLSRPIYTVTNYANNYQGIGELLVDINVVVKMQIALTFSTHTNIQKHCHKK